MYFIKSLIYKCIEVYENRSSEYHGYKSFFIAYSHVIVYNYVKSNKKLPVDDINMINKILYMFRNEKDKMKKTKLQIKIKKIIDAKYDVIYDFLDSHKDLDYVSNIDLDIDRTKVRGCIGTVVED
jgi:hypothetical protein